MKKTFKLLVSSLLLLVFSLAVFAGCGQSEDGKITVTFDANCTEITFDQTKKVSSGEAYGELPVITDIRLGYTFDGWSLKKDGTGKAVTAETIVSETSGNHTLYAKWKGNEYELSFDLQGGTINEQTTITSVKVTYGNMYGGMAIPNNPAKEGFKFIGWYLNAEGTGDAVTMSSKVTTAANHTLYAKWKEKYTNYTFDEPEMLDDWSVRNDNINIEVVDIDGDKKLKATNPDDSKKDWWVVLFTDLKAGQSVDIEVKFDGELNGEKAGFYCYGATAAGDPKTSGNLGEAGNPDWYWGQGFYSDHEGWNGGSFTLHVNIKEDCYGVSICLTFGETVSVWKNTAFYIDNVKINPAVTEA